jgi:hypothetical protein
MCPWDDDTDDGYVPRAEKPAQRTLDGRATKCLLRGCGHRLGDHRDNGCYKCTGDRNLHRFCATRAQVRDAIENDPIDVGE